ncbi:MAG: c-type cytochrome [Pirellulales bacterium]|nr:c-type cytochrome [Pirellulales bacterium]
MNQNDLPRPEPTNQLLGHNYDGIEEYDNPLPGWWKWLFVATIGFSPLYFLYYHGGGEGRTLADQYDQAYAAHVQLQFAEIGELPLNRDSVVKYLYDESWLKFGKSIFKNNCTQCHAKDGGGLVGPNLCDQEYKNVKDIGDILTVIQNGAGGGAMPPWKTRLSPNELVMVSSYVASLRGTTPAKAKDAEGRTIDPWPAAPPPEEEAAAEVTDATELSSVNGNTTDA